MFWLNKFNNLIKTRTEFTQIWKVILLSESPIKWECWTFTQAKNRMSKKSSAKTKHMTKVQRHMDVCLCVYFVFGSQRKSVLRIFWLDFNFFRGSADSVYIYKSAEFTVSFHVRAWFTSIYLGSFLFKFIQFYREFQFYEAVTNKMIVRANETQLCF